MDTTASPTSYYDILGVDPKSQTLDDDVKQAYRKLSRKYHPDRPKGDEKKFKEVSEANEVLSDAKKRDLYDQGGKEAVERGFAGNPQADFFERAFGFGMGSSGAQSGRRGPRKTPATSKELRLSLEQMYNGCRKKFRITRTRVKGPEGMSCDEMARPCTACGGRGVVLKEMNTSQQRMLIQQHCTACGGEGSVLADGVTESREKTIIEVVVEPGITAGERITFAGQGDEKPGMLPGDVVFVVAEEPHPTFKRRHADLLLPKTISLADALCGASFVVDTLDGRRLQVEAPDGGIIKHQDVMAIEEEGMPVHGSPIARGRLFVVFDVEMPAAGSLTTNEKTLLGRILPGRTTPLPAEEKKPAVASTPTAVKMPGPDVDVDMPDAPGADAASGTPDASVHLERVVLAPVDVKSFGMSGKGPRSAEAYESDDEEGGGFRSMGAGNGGGVQCAQQ